MSKVLVWLVLVGCSRGLWGQAGGAAGVLVEMAAQAGVIFAGQVLSVTRHDEQGYVEIGFQVDSAVRGCAAGGGYTVREWSGRWVGHSERYKVGQRLLMLLTAPGPAGLSAPVYGTDGAIRIVAGGIAGTADAGAVETTVDLRLLAARVVPVAAGTVHDDSIPLLPVAVDGSAAVWPALTGVLTLLRGGVSAGR